MSDYRRNCEQCKSTSHSVRLVRGVRLCARCQGHAEIAALLRCWRAA